MRIFSHSHSLPFLGAPLVVRVTHASCESALAQIAQLVLDAETSKAPIQQLADRIAGWFVPGVLTTSSFTFVTWFLLGITQLVSLPSFRVRTYKLHIITSIIGTLCMYAPRYLGGFLCGWALVNILAHFSDCPNVIIY